VSILELQLEPTTLIGFFNVSLQVQLEPTTSWGVLQSNVYGPSKYTRLLQATKDILHEEGLPVCSFSWTFVDSYVLRNKHVDFL
jgi:hypothetical protein